MKLTKIGIIILIVGMLLITACGPGNKYESFAKCLSDNGAKMYGAFWCPHCKTQKAQFGDAWKYVNYIECSMPDGKTQTQVCKQAGIEGYPTWEYADGTRSDSIPTFQQLSQITGCELP